MIAFTAPFELGWLNLWICSALIFILSSMITLFSRGCWRRAVSAPKLFGKEKIIYYTWILINFFVFFYSIFVPIIVESIWSILGLVVFILGLIMNLKAGYDYRGTPKDQLITKGIYKISRNPDYFSAFLMYMGMGLIGAAWPMLILAILHLLFYQITTKYEERMCVEIWGEEFKKYKKKVAKNFLFF